MTPLEGQLLGALGRLHAAVIKELHERRVARPGGELVIAAEAAQRLMQELDALPVRDGFVGKATLVWWRAEAGPKEVIASAHWTNIQEYPQHYQLTQPKTQLTYLD